MPHNSIAIPAPDQGWILYSSGTDIRREANLSDLTEKQRDVVVALPSAVVSSFSLQLPPTDSSLHPSMILAQVDKRGLSGRGSALVDYEVLEKSDDGVSFSVRAIPDLPASCLLPKAAGYTTYTLLRAPELTSGKSPSTLSSAIWQEQGRFVFAVFLGKEPIHSQVLSSKPELGKALASEINLILLALRSESVTTEKRLDSLTLLLDDVSDDDVAAFRNLITIPLHRLAPRPPSSASPRSALLPAESVALRHRRRNLIRAIALITLALVIYIVGGAWVLKKAKATEKEIVTLERAVEIAEPDVQRIRQEQERWQELRPAFDKTLFPVIQLSRITSALPGSGVVIREYRTSGRDIRLRGQARDVQLANRLVEDLEGMESFKSYEWRMPNPRVEKNNTATFEIEGKWKQNEATDK